MKILKIIAWFVSWFIVIHKLASQMATKIIAANVAKTQLRQMKINKLAR